MNENSIQNIALDLRVNDGGDSRVITEFISYLNVDEYICYGANIRFSEDVREITKESEYGYKHYPPSVEKNNKVTTDLLFKGNLFILTCKNTFSSANMFAVTLKDNKIGKIIGEPTGNQPTCYGNPLNFVTPNTQMHFTVSFKQFLRPNSNADSEDSLYPDVEVYAKIIDIVDKKDTHIEKLIELFREKVIYH